MTGLIYITCTLKKKNCIHAIEEQFFVQWTFLQNNLFSFLRVKNMWIIRITFFTMKKTFVVRKGSMDDKVFTWIPMKECMFKMPCCNTPSMVANCTTEEKNTILALIWTFHDVKAPTYEIRYNGVKNMANILVQRLLFWITCWKPRIKSESNRLFTLIPPICRPLI